jgi:16S rRNA (guanine966-N2)-methyltransferase
VGSVRIVGGALRGRRIRVPERGVRPTSDRTREAIFDILGPDLVPGARVLDLYAGTGALGIEALSRGAARADFLDGAATVARSLERNLEVLGLEDRAHVWTADLERARLPAGPTGPWDLVFLDPPYDGDAGPRWIAWMAGAEVLDERGVLVYERRKGAAVPAPPPWTLATDRTYGETSVAFYRPAGGSGRA